MPVKDSYKMWARRNYGASVFPDSLYWCDALGFAFAFAFALNRRREMLCKIYHFIHDPRLTAKSPRGTNLYRVCSLGHIDRRTIGQWSHTTLAALVTSTPLSYINGLTARGGRHESQIRCARARSRTAMAMSRFYFPVPSCEEALFVVNIVVTPNLVRHQSCPPDLSATRVVLACGSSSRAPAQKLSVR